MVLMALVAVDHDHPAGGGVHAVVVTYCDHHAGTVASQPGRLNPYKVGLELLRDIEVRWNTGRYGKDYDECRDMETRRNWGRDVSMPERVVGKSSIGREKIFEVRRIHNDVTFIDEFLQREACIYEMVINNDPCYAYLLTDNAMVDQKLVMAHVYAHCDFFKNNTWFKHTNRSGRRQQQRIRQPRVLHDPSGAPAQVGEHVRLLPGGQRLRQRELHQRVARKPRQ